MKRDAGPLRIGFDHPFHPLAWQEAGRAEGPLLAMVRLVLEAEALPHAFVPLALQDSLDALARGEVDALAFKAVVPGRGGTVVFSAPLMTTGAALFQLDPARVPRVLATPARGPLMALVAQRFPQARVVAAEDYPDSLARVVRGEADAAALNVHAGWAFAERLHPGRFRFPEDILARLELAMAPGPALAQCCGARLDARIRTLRAAGRFDALLRSAGVPVLADAA